MTETRRRITTNLSWNDLAEQYSTEKVKEMMEKKKAPAVLKGKKKVGVAYRSFYHSILKFIPDAVLVDPSRTRISNLDMVIFTGGEDISPSIYGQENKYSCGVNENRDMTEQMVFNYARELRKYMVGFCRGHQLLNCLLGGSLHQDFTNSGFKYHPGEHPLESSDGIIKNYFGNQEVISAHHQAVDKIGEGLKPTSYFMGIVESLEGNKILTTQFHPEFESSSTEHAKNFFKFLVEEF